MAKFTAIVKKKVTSRSPAINTYGKQVLLGPDGKELPKDANNQYIGTGKQKIEEIVTESIDDPLTDEAGNPIERGTVDALLSAIKEAFAEDDNVEILHVTVQETKTVSEISGADLLAKK